MIALAKNQKKSSFFKAQLLLGFLVLFIGCSNKRNQFIINGTTMGTTYSIKFISPSDSIYNESIQTDVDSLLNQLNKQMSTWDPESEISMFNLWKSVEPYHVSSPLIEVVNHSKDISIKTDGFFDITVYEMMRLWGFGPNPKSGFPTNDEIKSVVKNTGYNKIRGINETLIKNNKNIKIDLNAIAKGYGVDIIFDYFMKKDFRDVFIEIGGEVRSSGTNSKNQKWTIGIEDPLVEGSTDNGICAILHLNNRSVATSGNYRNIINIDGEILGHTINPKTGYPIQTDVLSVTVLSELCMVADAWATALMAMDYDSGYKKVNNNPEIDAIWVVEDSIYHNRYVSISGEIELEKLRYSLR